MEETLIENKSGQKNSQLNRLKQEKLVASSLRETLAVLNSNKTLQEILEFIVDQAARVMQADGVSIYSPQGKNGFLKIKASRGLPESYIQKAIIPLGLLATGYATLMRQTVIIPDLDQINDNKIPFDLERKKILENLSQNFKALLAVPLIFPKGEVFGTLDLYYLQTHEFSEGEIQMAKAFSNQTMLAIENARLRERAEQLAILSERDRLARDLHDTVTQTLFSASLIADVLPTIWKKSPKDGLIGLEELRQLTKGALAEMRTLLFELRPASLLTAEFDHLLQQLSDAFNSQTRIPVDLTIDEAAYIIPSDIKIAMYRITQEALNNINKHAEANQVIIHLTKAPPPRQAHEPRKKVRLSIKDDGKGFLEENINSNHLGLKIMKERAMEIGIGLIIHSHPGQGTEIIMTW